MNRLGLNVSEYACHSFRIGTATLSVLAGVPDHVIKTLGRWESEAYVCKDLSKIGKSFHSSLDIDDQ